MLPDGRLASSSADNTIRLWDVTIGAQTARLEGHSSLSLRSGVLPDGRLASGSSDNTIRLWDVNTGADAVRLEGHSGPVEPLCVLPEGRLASGSADNTIRLWDVRTGAETARLERDSDSGHGLCVMRDGRFASGSLTAHPALGRQDRCRDRPTGGTLGTVAALCALPDGRLASGSLDNTIRLWDVKIGAETARLETDAPIHSLISLPTGLLVPATASGVCIGCRCGFR